MKKEIFQSLRIYLVVILAAAFIIPACSKKNDQTKSDEKGPKSDTIKVPGYENKRSEVQKDTTGKPEPIKENGQPLAKYKVGTTSCEIIKDITGHKVKWADGRINALDLDFTNQQLLVWLEKREGDTKTIGRFNFDGMDHANGTYVDSAGTKMQIIQVE